MSFKIGDKVKRTDYNIESSVLNVGDEGIVREIIIERDYSPPIYIYMVEFYKTKNKNYQGSRYGMLEEKIELINKKKGNLGGF